MRARIGVVVAMLAAVTGSIVPGAAAPAPVATLQPGASAFWTAAKAPVRQEEDAFRREFRISVARGGHRLRVAIDYPSAREPHNLALISPAGESESGRGWFSQEVYADMPAAGTWTAIVYSRSDRPEYRMRAMLERHVTSSRRTAKREMLPNLRLIPPFEFTFRDPNDLSAGPPGGPATTPNCLPDEVAENGARRCLRFSLGPINSGEGPFHLRFAGDGEGLVLPGRVWQTIYYSDGSTSERLAGEAQYHKTHMHYHHSGFGTLELLKVTDARRGTLQAAGAGPKQGFCTADIILYEWRRFGPDQDSTESQCLNDMSALGTFNPTGTQMGITPGWADTYSWSQSGNYVEFGANGDGRYVVRATADALGHVLESNERDNTSYAYIEIRGETIRVLERGFGASPWDRRKQRATDLLLPTPRF